MSFFPLENGGKSRPIVIEMNYGEAEEVRGCACTLKAESVGAAISYGEGENNSSRDKCPKGSHRQGK
jgi:hypothetical protein